MNVNLFLVKFMFENIIVLFRTKKIIGEMMEECFAVAGLEFLAW